MQWLLHAMVVACGTAYKCLGSVSVNNIYLLPGTWAIQGTGRTGFTIDFQSRSEQDFVRIRFQRKTTLTTAIDC